MASAIEQSRMFARAYKIGSARARSRVTGAEPLGPTPFPVGGVSPEAAVLKVAHAILASSAIQQRRAAEQEMAEREFEKSELELGKLRREAEEPRYSFRTPTGAVVSGLTGAQRVEAENKFTTEPKTATPRAPVKLTQPIGRLAPGEYDPALVNAELAHQRIVEQKARAERRTTATKRYTAAAAGLRQIEKDKERRIAGARAEFEVTLRGLVQRAMAGDKEARAGLGLPDNWNRSTTDGQTVLADRLKGLREDFDRRMGTLFEKRLGHRRRPFEQTIEQEGAALLETQEPEQREEQTHPFEGAVLGALGGLGAEGP